MDISRVKTEQLSTGELLSISFSVWLRSLWPTVKLAFIFFVVLCAAIIGGLVAFAVLSPQAWLVLFSVASAALSVFLSFGVFTFSPIAEDIINGGSPCVVDGLAKICSSLHKFIGASLLIGACFLVIYIPVILFKSPLIILPLMLLLFLLYVITTPYIMFFPMAIYLRGAGPIDSIKYSYYMVKGRWLKVLGWILLCMVLNIFLSLGMMLLFKGAAHGLSQSIGPKMLSLMFGGGGLFSIILTVGGVIFAGIFIFLLIYSFWMSAFTSMFLNLEFEPQEKTLHGDYDDEEDNLVDSSQPNEITEMFKNIKEVDVNVTSHTERRTALGPQNREEALRAFKKDDQIALPPVVPTITAPHSAPIPPQTSSAEAEQPRQEHAEPVGMPTITIREKKDNIYHGLPSIYKPENDK